MWESYPHFFKFINITRSTENFPLCIYINDSMNPILYIYECFSTLCIVYYQIFDNPYCG